MLSITLTVDNRLAIEGSYHDNMLLKQLSTRFDPRIKRWTMARNMQSVIELTMNFDEIKWGDGTADLRYWAEGELSREGWYDALRSTEYHKGTDLLRPEQMADREFMLDAQGFGLFHQTGWGKTRTAASACGGMPVLVIAPKSVLYQWAAEFKRVDGSLRVAVVEGTAKQRERTLVDEADVWVIGWSNIASHSALAGYGSINLSDKDRQHGRLNRPWGTVIFDEAHRLADPHARWTRAAWKISEQADYRYALTGTPINGKPESLWSMVHAIQPEVWPVRSKFLDRYCLTGFNPWGGFEVYGFKTETKPEFDRILASFTNRRLLELSEPRRVVRHLGMDSKQRTQYESMANDYRLWLDNGDLVVSENPLTRANHLYKLASVSLDAEGNPSYPSNKVDALCDLVEELDGEPLVVFGVHRGVIDLAAKALHTRHKLSPLVINGDTPSRERSTMVERFSTGKLPVLMGTVGAMAEGVDGLQTSCRTAAFLQRPWSYIQNVQAEGRLQRTGQAHSVLTYDFVSLDSIDGHVLDTLLIKGENFEDVVRDRERLHKVLHEQRNPDVQEMPAEMVLRLGAEAPAEAACRGLY